MRLLLVTRTLSSMLLLMAASPAAFSDSLATSNQATFARAFALPGLGEFAPPPARESHWRLSAEITTEYALDLEAGEQLLIDGETQRYAFAYRQAWGEAFDWGIEIPLLHTGGGFMDSFIEGWHDTFGLPNGGRDSAPQDRRQVRYVRDGVTQFDVRGRDTGLGDVLLSAGWSPAERWMLRSQLKLPTGDEDQLAGGNWGAALWADAALPFDESSAWGGFVSAGVSANEEAAVLASLQNAVIPFGGVGLDVRLLPRLQALVQLYAHAPLYDDTEIDALERPGVQLTFGGRWCFSEAHCLELSFQEDLAVASSPDFSLRFALLWR